MENSDEGKKRGGEVRGRKGRGGKQSEKTTKKQTGVATGSEL